MSLKIYKTIQYTVYCDKCHATQSWYTNDTELQSLKLPIIPDDFFKRSGWGDACGVTLCPNCIKELTDTELKGL